MSNNNKKFSNGNRYLSNEGSWAETSQYQQKACPQTRKQPKFQHNKNANSKYYSKTHYAYNNRSQSNSNNQNVAVVENREIHQHQNSDNNIAVNDTNINNQYVKSTLDQNVGIEYTNTETSTVTCNSPIDSSEKNEKLLAKTEQNIHTQNVYDQTLVLAQAPTGDIPHSEVNGCYSNANYEYDYQQNNFQQQSQYYIYQPYQDYSQVSNMTGSPLNSSFTGNSQQQYISAYQPVPSYIYDPQAGSYTSAYSPVQSSVHQHFQQTPSRTNLSSPQTQQQQPSFLASYQTPPQPAHQLYIQTSNITPPTSLSPNDTPSTNSSATAGTDRQSNCNSPPTHNGIVPTHLTQTPVHNPYVLYNMDMSGIQHSQYNIPSHANSSMYTPMTPQAYQCNSPLPTSQFMMYNPSISHGSPYPTGSPNSPMTQAPLNASKSTSSFNNSQQKYKYNRNNGLGNQQYQQNKRNYNGNNNYGDQTLQSTYDENSIYMNTQSVQATNYEQEFADSVNHEATQISSIYPPSPYCDPSIAMLSPQEILAHYHNNYENIETYGEDYDNYDESCNGDENDENLACQICRGRRMCFCYFLKVRYYKFPSFFDLVDHQYKKWRKTIAQNNLMQQQQNQLISSPNGYVNQNNLSPNISQTSITKKA